MTEREYRKLPGRGIQLFTPSSLHLGRDHLLKVTYIGGAEEYKRFYFSDIQAVILRRTVAYLWWAMGLGAVAALFLLWGVSALNGAGGNAADRVVAGLILGSAGMLILGLLIHLLLGPTCKVVLKTAVHSEPLPTLGRVRSAHKAIARLTEPVERSQAGIEISEVQADDGSQADQSNVAAPLQATPEQ